MNALIRISYNICFPLFWAFLFFSISMYMMYFFSGILPVWNCDFNKVPVKIESYETGSFGKGGEVNYSIGYYANKKIKIDGILKLDSVYIVWHCVNDNTSYIVRSKDETVTQFKSRRLLYRIKFLIIILAINFSLFGLSKYLGSLMKKHDISKNDV
jgi:hypothetical protein